MSRRREKREGVGRPRFKYYVEDPSKVISRIEADIDMCALEFKKKVRSLIETSKPQS